MMSWLASSVFGAHLGNLMPTTRWGSVCFLIFSHHGGKHGPKGSRCEIGPSLFVHSFFSWWLLIPLPPEYQERFTIHRVVSVLSIDLEPTSFDCCTVLIVTLSLIARLHKGAQAITHHGWNTASLKTIETNCQPAKDCRETICFCRESQGTNHGHSP